MLVVEDRSQSFIKTESRRALTTNIGCLPCPSNLALLVLIVCSTLINSVIQSAVIGEVELNSLTNSTYQHLIKPEARSKKLAYIKSNYLDSVEHAYKPDFLSEYPQHNKLSISHLIHVEVIAKIYSFFLADVFLQRYEDPEDLKISGGPQANQELCLKQLGQLIDRANVLRDEKSKSRDVEMFLLLDTFGRVPAGVLGGEVSWLGSYWGCLNSRISLDDEGRIAMRYCASSFKLNDWPEDKELDEYAVLKLAVCLPKSCDSIDYKNKFQLVQQLAQFNSRQFDFGTWNFTYLYCLPDEQSNLRIWWKSPGTVVATCFVVGWLSLLIFASIKHKKSFAQKRASNRDKKFTPSFDISSGLKLSSLDTADQSPEDKKRLKLYRALSIYNSFRNLIDTKTHRSLTNAIRNSSVNKPIVDLAPLDGFKAISMIYIILGHGLFINTLLNRNWRDFLNTSFIFIVLSPAAALSVNSFFTMTGMLATYLLFKQKTPEEMSSMATPKKWFQFVLYRYLRLMPIYLVIVAYQKYFAIYTGSGPLWDYGTSFESPKRNCRQQPWLWTLLFSDNLMSDSVLGCIPPAWYINNDLQFALITPLILACLGKSETLGKLLIGLIISASILASTVSRFIQPALDYRPFTKGFAYALKINVATENRMYIEPQHRIPPYLIGLLLGLLLHHYEQNKLKWLEARSKQQNTILQQSNNETTKTEEELKELEPNWSTNYRQHLPTIFLIYIAISYFAAPNLAPNLQFTKVQAQFLTTFGVPYLLCSSALVIGLYLVLAVTGHGFKQFNKFLSLRFWKPISRLGLCALLVNFEVVVFLSGRTAHMEYFDTQFQLVVSIFIVLVTYSVSAILYVLFESPMREIINLLLALARSSYRRRYPEHKSS